MRSQLSGLRIQVNPIIHLDDIGAASVVDSTCEITLGTVIIPVLVILRVFDGEHDRVLRRGEGHQSLLHSNPLISIVVRLGEKDKKEKENEKEGERAAQDIKKMGRFIDKS